MRTLRPATRIYVLTMVLCGSFVVSAGVWASLPWSPAVLLVALGLTLIYSLVEYASVELPLPGYQTALISLVDAPAIVALLTLGAAGIVPVAAGTLLVTRWAQRFPWRDTLLATAWRALAYTAALGVYATAGAQVAATSPLAVGVLLLTLLAHFAADAFGSSLNACFINRQPFVTNLRGVVTQGAWISFIPLGMGALAGRIARTDPWLLMLLTIPLLVAYAALRAIAQALVVEQHARQLQINLAVVEQLNTLRIRFLANISHDLKTPVSVIIGLAHRLTQPRSGALTERQQQIAAMIGTNAASLDQLVNDLLDIAKLEVGQLKLACRPVAIEPVVAESLATVASLLEAEPAKRAALALGAPLPPDLPLVWADRGRLRQVLVNLLTNAVTFTEHGHIHVTAVPTPDALTISVSDTGIGIPPEQQAAVFQAFHQVDPAAGLAPRGSGLGLAICQQLVELQGDHIWLTSTPGAGTTISFTAPYAAPDPARVSADPAHDAQRLLQEGAGHGA